MAAFEYHPPFLGGERGTMQPEALGLTACPGCGTFIPDDWAERGGACEECARRPKQIEAAP